MQAGRHNLSHRKHRSIRFHDYGARTPVNRWHALLASIERKRAETCHAQRTEPMFNSIAELVEWQKRTRFGRSR